ncbi:helix-turn-helix domain-containing protein [Candidatus Micrarchaeota archaeon]|nr:helix-turn-helix domain-containing protein [Candidatus Micrarchaeota archaeon]
MQTDSKEFFEFKKKLRFLQSIRGEGTELISVLIPPGANVADVANRLREEASQAMNIKSKQTRKNVQSALESIMGAIKGVPKPPENGVAIYCGSINGKIEQYMLVPPEPVPLSIYRCDSAFFTKPFEEMIEHKETFGLFVLDKREAIVATLHGKKVDILRKLTSGIPGKHHVGGQCIASDSLIQLGDGAVCQIGKAPLGRVCSVSQSTYQTTMAECAKVFKRKSDSAYLIRTKYPSARIVATPEHWFFSLDGRGLGLKSAGELAKGDTIMAVKRINFEGKRIPLGLKILPTPELTEEGRKHLATQRVEKRLLQREVAKKLGIAQATLSKVELGIGKIGFEKINKLLEIYGIDKGLFHERYVRNAKTFKMPEYLDEEFAQLLGYTIGDGCVEEHRIRLYDERKEVLDEYKRIALTLGLVGVIRHNPRKNYYQLTICCKELAGIIRDKFGEALLPSALAEVPVSAMRSPNSIVAAFARGLFDAEGYVQSRSGRIGITTTSKKLMEQLRMMLLRLGIVTSFREKISPPNWKVKSASLQYSLEINDEDSLNNFIKFVGFTSREKFGKIRRRGEEASRIDQIPMSGSHVLRLARQVGLNTRSFRTGNNFFRNERSMGRKVFKRVILREFENWQRVLEKTDPQKSAECKEIVLFLRQVLDSDLIPSYVVEKQKIEPDGILFCDLNVPRQESYVANGFMLHNSAMRFQRLHEIAVHEFFKRIGDACNGVFSDKKIKAIIAGGSGPTKYDFINGEYLQTEVKNKIRGTVDTGYTDETGIKELVEHADEVIEKMEITKERDLVNRFLKEVVTSGLACYGEEETRKALELRKADILLLSEELAMRKLLLKCNNCGKIVESVVKEIDSDYRCHCGGKQSVESDTELMEELTQLAESSGASIEIISTETAEGKQFLQGFGGIGALLRYR